MRDILYRLFGPDPDTLNAYRSVIPSTLGFRNEKEGDSIVIKITEIDGEAVDDNTLLITQADKESEIVPAINDLIMTYFDIPNELRRYYEKELVLQGDLHKNAVLTKVA